MDTSCAQDAEGDDTGEGNPRRDEKQISCSLSSPGKRERERMYVRGARALPRSPTRTHNARTGAQCASGVMDRYGY